MLATLEFKKIVPEGKAMGHVDGRACFVVGPLPGEVAQVELVKIKDRYTEGVLREVSAASKYRHAPAEEHYLLCSPWQGVEYNFQLELKRQMLEECFGRPELHLRVAGVVGAPSPLGYRNKLEFALKLGEGGLGLALHERGVHDRLISAPQGCALGNEAMNAMALEILRRLNDLNVGDAGRRITIRQSQTSKKILAVVDLNRSITRDWSALKDLELAGVIVSLVRAGRPANVVWQVGATELGEMLAGVELRYPFDSFFQVNVPVFEQALIKIIDTVPDGARVVDLYGGVGAIGLPVARRAKWVRGVEVSENSVAWAYANAARAGLENYHAVAVPAEHMNAGVLDGADCVIVDPPRAGLHRRVVDMLLETQPARIIYLSCNPVTQARDLMLLAGAYQAQDVTGFDFYPGTTHVESLVVFHRK